MNRWVLDIPILPMAMNVRERRSHWVRSKELRELTDAIGWAAIAQKIPAASGKRGVSIELHKSLRSRKADDPANRDSRAKGVLDALVRLGLLVDDDDTHLLWLGVHEGERRAQPGITIRLGDV